MGSRATSESGRTRHPRVETTLRHAVCLDYLATMVSDCCASSTPERHEQALGQVTQSFGSVASPGEIAAIWGVTLAVDSGRVLTQELPS